MTTIEKVGASTNGERELSISRLMDIDGIARKTAEAMYAMGIRCCTDLTQYLSERTAIQVSAALKEHGVNRPPAFIDWPTWVGQAAELAELEEPAPTPPEKDADPSAGLEEVPSSRPARGHDAEFTVSFEVRTDGDQAPVLFTTVSEGTNGSQKGTFQGSDAAPWVNWILERAELPSAALMVPEKRNDARIEVRDIQLSVLGSTSDSRGKKLQAEIRFRLSGVGAAMLAARGISFRIEGYTIESESGVSELVASEQSRLAPHVFTYSGRLEFGMPAVGRYEFYSLVLLHPPGETAAYFRGPNIRVTP